MPDELVEDIELFTRDNTVGSIHFWGQELALLDAVLTYKHRELHQLPLCHISLILTWVETLLPGESELTMDRMYSPRVGPDYALQVVEALEAIESM